MLKLAKPARIDKQNGFLSRQKSVHYALAPLPQLKSQDDSTPAAPTPRRQRSTCERLAYDLPERRMLEWTSLSLRLSNFPTFCVGLWYGSVCTSGAELVGGGLGHAPSRSKIGGPLRARGRETLALN